VPTFGSIDHYVVYRKASTGTTFSKLNPATPITGTSFTDTTSAGCTTYTYFVTATIADATAQNGYRESIASNRQTISTACNFIGFVSPLQTAGSGSYSGAYSLGKTIGISWQLQDPATLKFVGTLAFNTLGYKYVSGVPASGKCAGPGNVTPGGFTPPANGTLYPPSGLSYDSKKNQFGYSWNTTGLTAGCYVIEVDIPFGLSPQAKASATTVLLK